MLFIVNARVDTSPTLANSLLLDQPQEFPLSLSPAACTWGAISAPTGENMPWPTGLQLFRLRSPQTHAPLPSEANSTGSQSLEEVAWPSWQPWLPYLSPPGAPPLAHGLGPHVSPLGLSTPAAAMVQQGQTPAPHSPALPGRGPTKPCPPAGPRPSLCVSPTPGRCLMARSGSAPVPPICPAPG